ncbi:MAG: peptidylprolyl isomerase [Pseudomonadota bacterium]
MFSYKHPAFSLITAAILGFAGATPSDELDRIIAIVDQDIIVQSELDEQMLRVREQIRQSGGESPPTSVLERQVIERLVLEKIQLQLADEIGVDVPEEGLNQAIIDIARKNDLSMDEFRSILESEGYEFEAFRAQIRQEMTVAELIKEEVGRRVRVLPSEVENYLRNESLAGESSVEFRISHILIEIPGGANDDEARAARSDAQRVLDAIVAGDDFTSLAITRSDGQNALDGGDLGWRKAERLPSLFIEPLSRLQIGEVSEILTSSSGYHIIKLVDKRQGEKVLVEQHNVRHILIETNELVDDLAALEHLSQLKIRLESGDDFATLAKTHSDDRTSALAGGDLGWVSKGQMVPEFEEIMEVADIGMYAGPIKSEFGYHILQVRERRTIDGTEDAQRARARRAIQRRKFDEARQAWLRRLRDEAYVEYRI